MLVMLLYHFINLYANINVHDIHVAPFIILLLVFWSFDVSWQLRIINQKYYVHLYIYLIMDECTACPQLPVSKFKLILYKLYEYLSCHIYVYIISFTIMVSLCSCCAWLLCIVTYTTGCVEMSWISIRNAVGNIVLDAVEVWLYFFLQSLSPHFNF